jgi:hypothetical protein
MSEITISNTDWSVLDAVKTALSGAAEGGEAIFASVVMSSSVSHMRQVQLAGKMPRTIILYKGTNEHNGTDGTRFGWVTLELILATRVSSGSDASGRVQDILRHKNAAINAVETDRPERAVGAATADLYRPAILWRPADIELSEPGIDPWVLCRLGLEVTYTLATGTSH